MRPEDRDPAYLWDMLEAAKEVEVMLENYDIATFLESRVHVRATERSIELVGEAARPGR